MIIKKIIATNRKLMGNTIFFGVDMIYTVT